MTNRLAGETSPYLVQHRDNPVDWYPWGPEALARAQAENRPILLSVGYAACHWCHVMAHESFEDEATAALMNRLFVNIKVDREERPDLDTIYQTALALTGQQGGWPLTMFLRPDGHPFAGGTYFPPERRYGRPAFRDVLQQVAEIYEKEPERIEASQAAIMARLKPALNPQAAGELSLEALDAIAAQLVETVDFAHGGIGEAPKFPNTPTLELLWRAYWRTGIERHREAVEVTLTHMCQGGIYDHLGGGFARYSVDAEWLVPHFEKMLYDNAQLVELMTLVWLTTRSPLLAQRIDETIQWLMREMRHPQGGFYSSLDADSEGHEGRFYVWSKAEILEVLGADDGEFFSSAYGVTEDGNFEGANILNRLGSLKLRDEAHEMRLGRCREKLLARRAHRVRPGLDDKILADWNGLAIIALAKAGAALNRADWVDAGREAFTFLTGQMIENNRLSHAWRGSLGAHPALAEDCANLLAAAITLAETTAEPTTLALAGRMVRDIGERFGAEGGAYYQAPNDAADVIVRSRTIWDNAAPPANATMLGVLGRLFALTGDPACEALAHNIAKVFAGAALRNPAGAASFLNASEVLMAPVLVGLAGEQPGGTLARGTFASGDPNRIVAWIGARELAKAHALHGKTPVGGKPTAYVCRGQACSLPVTEPEALRRLLERPG